MKGGIDVKVKIKIKKDMGLGLLALSAFFLFNPFIGFVDILPDCIGFLLICNGLRFMADMDGHLDEAKRRFRILFWAGAAQFFLQIMVYNFMQERSGEAVDPGQLPNTVMLLSFIWLVLYLLVLIPAFRQLFLGLDRISERFGYELPQNKRQRKSSQKTAGERMTVKTAVFVFAVSLLGFLPELATMASLEYSRGNSRFLFDWYEFIGLFRVLAVFLALGFALSWLFSFSRYILTLKKEKSWLVRMKEHYVAEVLPQTGMLAIRRFSSAFLVLYVGIIFAIHLRMNFYSCLPGIMFAFLVIAGVSSLGDLLPEKKNIYIASIALSVFSLGQLIANYLYLQKYLPEESLFNPNAFWHYLVVQALDVGETLCTLILIACLLQVLSVVIQNYTSVQYGGKRSEQLSSRATQKLHNSLSVRLYVIFILFFVAAIGNIVDIIFHLQFGWLWLIPLCFSVIGVFCYQSLQHDLLEEIRFQYQSEDFHPQK